MRKTTPFAHIDMRRGYNNTAANKETALIVWFDSFEIKDTLKADGYRFNGYDKTWEKSADDFDAFVHVVINSKLAPTVAQELIREAMEKGIDVKVEQKAMEDFSAYATAYYNN
jgi:hypothetical protein